MSRPKVTLIDYHRNGVSGEGFYVALLSERGTGTLGAGMAVLFPAYDAEGNIDRKATIAAGRCSVFNIPMLAKGNIAFAMGNSWRGDYYIAAVTNAAIKHAAQPLGEALGLPND